MANQTVTSDLTIGQVISNGLADGENITINAGAVITVDVSPTVLIGQVTINEGELFLDGENASDPIIYVGENAEEINVNGAGILRSSLGWWDFPTTGDGTASQTFDCSTYFSASGEIDADVFSGVWVETGRRINYDGGSGVSPQVGDWVFKTSDHDVHGRIEAVSGDGVTGHLIVTFLTGALADNDGIELHTIQDNNGPDYQKSWTALANGVDVLEAGVYQEFGNARQNAGNGLATIGSGMAGFCFEQTWQSNTLTFGDGTNGFIVPNGAHIRVPMVHFATSTLAQYALNNSTWQAGNGAKYNLETVNGGDCFLDGVSCGSAWLEDNLGGEFQASYCAANGGFGVYASLGRPTYDHCIFVGEIEGDTGSRARSVPAIVDLVAGADIRDCLGVWTNDAADTTQFGGQTSLGVNMERVIHIATANGQEFELVRINDFTMSDIVVIGSELRFTTCIGGTLDLLKTQRNVLGGVANSDQVVFNASASQIKLTGWEILQGSCPDDSKCAITDSNNIQVRGFHFIDDKFDNEALGGSQGEEFVAIGGLSNDILIARCWQNRGNPNEFAFLAAGTTKNVTIQNCSAEYSGEVEPDGINAQMRGLHSGSGSLGAGAGLETDYPGTAGAQMGDVFESNTRGYIYYRNVPGTDEYPITILAGNPRFTKDGDVDVVSGDQWEVDMGYFALGHTSFRGVLTTTRNALTAGEGVNNWTGVDIDFQYDTGSGFNGTWLNARTGSNWTAITNTVDGVRLKLRFTGNATQTNGQAITIHTNTTLADQAANLYPLDRLAMTVTGMPDGSIVVVYDDEDPDPQDLGTELARTNSSSNGAFSFSYGESKIGDSVVLKVIKVPEYKIYESEITLAANDTTIPIKLIAETN